jgi:RimJ/RimL family protein N-acetyltransferase
LPSAVRIDGETVVVRDLEPRDVDAFVAAYVDDPPQPSKPPSAVEVRAMLAAEPRWRETGERMQLAIADRASDAWVGSLTLHSFDWDERAAEVGFWVERAWRRRGIAVEAVRLAVGWAREQLQIVTMRLRTTAENAGAQRVAERAGFTSVGAARYECRA